MAYDKNKYKNNIVASPIEWRADLIFCKQSSYFLCSEMFFRIFQIHILINWGCQFCFLVGFLALSRQETGKFVERCTASRGSALASGSLYTCENNKNHWFFAAREDMTPRTMRHTATFKSMRIPCILQLSRTWPDRASQCKINRKCIFFIVFYSFPGPGPPGSAHRRQTKNNQFPYILQLSRAWPSMFGP